MNKFAKVWNWILDRFQKNGVLKLSIAGGLFLVSIILYKILQIKVFIGIAIIGLSYVFILFLISIGYAISNAIKTIFNK
jgi:hypothetical protein